MRILFFIGERAWTGSARAFVTAATGLHERGHEVTVVCDAESDVDAHLDRATYDVETTRTGGAWPVAARRFAATLRARESDVVFVHGARDAMVASSAARSVEHGRVIRRVAHGEQLGLKRRAMLPLGEQRTPLLFASAAELRRAEPVLPAGIETFVAPLGVDATAADSARAPARALVGASGATQLLVCAYDRTSRIRAAPVLRVTALLAPLHPELRLAVVGSGSTDEELRMHAAALRITKLVRFLGEQPDAFSVLRAADLGWVVSRGDDAAFAMLDFMAARVPVLAERSPLAEEYVADGITGVLFDTNGAADLSAPVARLLGLDAEREAMANAARTRAARDFPLSAMIDGFERAAEGVVARR